MRMSRNAHCLGFQPARLRLLLTGDRPGFRWRLSAAYLAKRKPPSFLFKAKVRESQVTGVVSNDIFNILGEAGRRLHVDVES